MNPIGAHKLSAGRISTHDKCQPASSAARIALRITRVESFIRLTAARRRQLEAEAVRIGEFLEAEVALSLGALG